MKRISRINIRSTARTTSNGNVRVRTTVSNGHTTRTITKTVRAK